MKVFLKGETSVITLEVRIRPGVTDYLINNRIHKKEKLRELRRMLKIDLNNLCQFLPQDRVADFVAQNPQKRLREFEKSVGGESLVRFRQLQFSSFLVQHSHRSDQHAAAAAYEREWDRSKGAGH